jgi:hypothetical protein
VLQAKSTLAPSGHQIIFNFVVCLFVCFFSLVPAAAAAAAAVVGRCCTTKNAGNGSRIKRIYSKTPRVCNTHRFPLKRVGPCK